MQNRKYTFLLLGCLAFLVQCQPRVEKLQVTFFMPIALENIGLSPVSKSTMPISSMIDYYYEAQKVYLVNRETKMIYVFDATGHLILELGNLKSNAPKPVQINSEERRLIAEEFGLSQEDSSLYRINNSTLSRKQFDFHEIGSFMVNTLGEIYVEDVMIPENEKINSSLEDVENTDVLTIVESNSKKIESKRQHKILKFSPEGKFLYYIGKDGRDNPPFEAMESVSLFIDQNQFLWLKYIQDGRVYLRYYTDYGKNLYALEYQIQPEDILKRFPAFKGDFSQMKFEMEDIFPILEAQRKMIVSYNIYQEEEEGMQLSYKLYLMIDNEGHVQDVYQDHEDNKDEILMTPMQENVFYTWSYYTKEKKYLLKKRQWKETNLIDRKSLETKHRYYDTVGIKLKQNGEIEEVFMNSKYIVLLNLV